MRRSRDRSSGAWIVWAALVALAAPVPAQELFLRDARIVDPAAGTSERGNLLIRDGRIAGRPKAPPEGFAGDVVDLEGRWLIPGLVDMHVHSYGNMAPDAFDPPGTATIVRRVLYAGVTGLLDLFGREETLDALRRAQRAGETGGADLYASLSCLTAPEGHCTEYGVPTRTMSDPEEAAAVVADLAQKRPDVIKIVYAPTGRMPSIDEKTLAAAVAAARERDIETVIHVQSWQDVRDAVAAGASAVTHVPDAEPVPADVVKAMASAGTWHIPTLAVQTDFAHFVGDPAVLASPLAAKLAPAPILEAYRKPATREHAAEHRATSREREAMVLASVRALAAGGVRMLAGTDAGNYGTLQGFSLHRELEKLVAAGLTPYQALAAATTSAGQFLGADLGVGDGDLANLVVLDASPIDDIRNTQKIVHVIHHGELVDREALLAPPPPPSPAAATSEAGDRP